MNLRALTITAVTAAAVLAVTAAFVLGGCGGSTEAATPGPATPAASPTTVPATLGGSQWDVPGLSPLPETRSVANEWVRSLCAERIPGAGLYHSQATWDYWPNDDHLQGAAEIEGVYREAAKDCDWSRGRVLLAPGVVAYEGTFIVRDGGKTSLPALCLLAVADKKVEHEEVFLDAGPTSKKPVAFAASPPGPQDTAEAAAEAAAAVGDAFARGDQTALGELLAPDVLFYDTGLRHGVRGVDAVLAWQRRTPTLDLSNHRPIAGPGWAVVRWTIGQTSDTGAQLEAAGATVAEVRDGKVVRMTLYYDDSVISLQD